MHNQHGYSLSFKQPTNTFIAKQSSFFRNAKYAMQEVICCHKFFVHLGATAFYSSCVFYLSGFLCLLERHFNVNSLMR